MDGGARGRGGFPLGATGVIRLLLPCPGVPLPYACARGLRTPCLTRDLQSCRPHPQAYSAAMLASQQDRCVGLGMVSRAVAVRGLAGVGSWRDGASSATSPTDVGDARGAWSPPPPERGMGGGPHPIGS